MMAPKILIQNENVPGIPSSEPIYVSSAFSSTSLGMQVLTTTIDTTVKEFAVQGSELPLLPNVNPTSTIGGNIVTTKEVSLSCDVTRPITVQSTPSCSTARIQEKTCLFTFNEDAETDNRANLNTTDLFDASLGLEDISPTKLPIGSNPSLDLISPSTSIAEISNSMNLVQTLGTSTINFINDVPDNSEIDIQQSSKQNSFSSNFVRGTRVTEIRCFVEKESTADHNYTLGDPLLGGNNEDKNILTTGLSLSNSPEEFQLNESHLEELSFNENNFIEENGTLEDLGLLLPCKKEKPDFDNIIDDTIPKPEDIQNSIKRLNMLVDISQGGQQKTISVDSTIDHTTNSDCSVSLGIDYAVNKLLFLGGGEVTSQNNSFSTIPDIENINIMESNVTSLHPKETLEDPINVKSRDESNSITSICTSYTNFIPTDSNHQKVVVEPVEQCTITSLDQLKKDYINDTCERVEKSKPVSKTSRETNVKSTPLYKQMKKDAIKNESVKVKDEMENYTIRRHNRTPVFPPKKKTVTQQHHTKSPPQSKKTEILSFDNNISFDSKSQAKSDTSRISETANECRIRVKTDLIKPTESKTHVSDLSQLDYITEDDQNIASEVVLPFRKPSPSEKVNLIETQEKKALEIISKTDVAVTKTTKHARFDKSGNDYIMENIINPHSDPKTRKNQVPEVKLAEKKGENSVDTNKKRKSTFSDNNDTSDSEKYIKRGDKRQKKSDDESDKIRGEHTKLHTKKPHDSSNNNKQKSQSSDEIFDKLVREGPVNKVFTQRISEQNTTAKSESSQINISSEVSKSRGHTTDNYRKDRISQSQSTAVSLHEAARYRDSVRHPYPDPEKRRDQRKPGYYQNYNAPPERRYADKRPSTVAVLDTSPKRFIRNSSHPYSSKSDPCSSRNHPYKSRDRRSSTEQLTNLLPNTNKSEGRTSHDENKFSWIDKFSDSGLFDTPSDLFMPP
ncbi:microtubule-associated protein futsch-like, partial [Asbolus verrucosus]